MSYDSVETLGKFHRRQKLQYPLLSDVNAEHVNAYGVRNLDYPPGNRAYGIPNPGILMLSTQGSIKAKFAVPGYRDRPPLADLYDELVDMMAEPVDASAEKVVPPQNLPDSARQANISMD